MGGVTIGGVTTTGLTSWAVASPMLATSTPATLRLRTRSHLRILVPLQWWPLYGTTLSNPSSAPATVQRKSSAINKVELVAWVNWPGARDSLRAGRSTTSCEVLSRLAARSSNSGALHRQPLGTLQLNPPVQWVCDQPITGLIKPINSPVNTEQNIVRSWGTPSR